MSSSAIRSRKPAGASSDTVPSRERPQGPPALRIRDALRSEDFVSDRVFDGVYPLWVRQKSNLHWTPVEVAVRAAALLAGKPGARLLDVGAGVGKFCIVAAAAVDAHVSGIEHRAHLVEIASRAAAHVGVDASFRRGTLTDCDPRAVDGIYLYNPFTENICSFADQIDETVELSAARYVRDIAATEEFLRAARLGTRVVTYCGFGGEMPPGYARVTHERHGGILELWVKTGRRCPIVATSSETRPGPAPLWERVFAERAEDDSR